MERGVRGVSPRPPSGGPIFLFDVALRCMSATRLYPPGYWGLPTPNFLLGLRFGKWHCPCQNEEHGAGQRDDEITSRVEAGERFGRALKESGRRGSGREANGEM